MSSLLARPIVPSRSRTQISRYSKHSFSLSLSLISLLTHSCVPLQSYTFIAKSVESKDQWLNSIQAQLSRLGSMKVFGASLTTLLKKEDRLDSIPKIVELCVAAIRARPDGMKTEGLFRVSPPKRELDQLRAQFDLSTFWHAPLAD